MRSFKLKAKNKYVCWAIINWAIEPTNQPTDEDKRSQNIVVKIDENRTKGMRNTTLSDIINQIPEGISRENISHVHVPWAAAAAADACVCTWTHQIQQWNDITQIQIQAHTWLFEKNSNDKVIGQQRKTHSVIGKCKNGGRERDMGEGKTHINVFRFGLKVLYLIAMDIRRQLNVSKEETRRKIKKKGTCKGIHF